MLGSSYRLWHNNNNNDNNDNNDNINNNFSSNRTSAENGSRFSSQKIV